MIKTNFIRIMGNTSINRILDFLIENDDESWSMVEIKEQANIGYSTLKLILPKMVESGLIKIHKVVGKTKLFKINKESHVVIKLYELYNTINLKETGKLMVAS